MGNHATRINRQPPNKSVKPGEHIVKIVSDELEALMGESDTRIPYDSKRPTVILMAGLQGSGKTTT